MSTNHREIDGGRVAKGRTSSIARLVDAAVGSHESFVGCVDDTEVVGCHFTDSVEGIVQIGVEIVVIVILILFVGNDLMNV